jgi:hypothetical protein
MSFVKRADGITYNVGGHYMSRGTLEQVKYGSTEDESTPEQENWLKEVIAAFMSAEDSLHLRSYALDGWMDENNEMISCIWGTYQDSCPHIKRKCFNEDYFWPDY